MHNDDLIIVSGHIRLGNLTQVDIKKSNSICLDSLYLQICFTLLATMAIDRNTNPNEFRPSVSKMSLKTRFSKKTIIACRCIIRFILDLI